MHGDAVLLRKSTDARDGLERINRSAAAIVRVLNADQGRLDAMRIFGTNRRLDRLWRHEASLAGHPVQLNAGQGSGRALLIPYDMGGAFDDYFTAGLRVNANRHLIGHR